MVGICKDLVYVYASRPHHQFLFYKERKKERLFFLSLSLSCPSLFDKSTYQFLHNYSNACLNFLSHVQLLVLFEHIRPIQRKIICFIYKRIESKQKLVDSLLLIIEKTAYSDTIAFQTTTVKFLDSIRSIYMTYIYISIHPISMSCQFITFLMVW